MVQARGEMRSSTRLKKLIIGQFVWMVDATVNNVPSEAATDGKPNQFHIALVVGTGLDGFFFAFYQWLQNGDVSVVGNFVENF